MRSTCRSAALAAVSVATLGGCSGVLDEAPSGPAVWSPDIASQFGVAGDGGGAGSDDEVVQKCAVRAVGPNPLRHLTREQHAHTVQDLLGVSPVGDALPEDDDTQGYEVGASMSNLLVEGYADQAAAMAEAVDVEALVDCDPASDGTSTCRDQFLASFGRRGYRRALGAADVQALTTLFEAGATDSRGFEGGVRLVVEGVLQSPHFLYHVLDADEPGDDGLRPLSPYALANRLSYLLWNSMPDDTLLDAAESGELETPEGMEREARRMIDERPEAARAGTASFLRQWLELDRLVGMERDETLFPDFTPALAEDLGESVLRTAGEALWESEQSFTTLLTGDSAWVNGSVAPLFDVSTPDGGAWAQVSLDPEERSGLLTHPGLLAALSKPNQSDPVIRGKFVRENLLCEPLKPPPANVATIPPDPRPGATTRERFAEHSEDPGCQVCHEQMDPIGFGLEHYDALGQFRLEDEGLAVDARGEIVGSNDAAGTFEGGLELSSMLADSNAARDCMALQYFRFAVGRVETEGDSCSVAKTMNRFEVEGGSFVELLVAIVRSDTFRFEQEGT